MIWQLKQLAKICMTTTALATFIVNYCGATKSSQLNPATRQSIAVLMPVLLSADSIEGKINNCWESIINLIIPGTDPGIAGGGKWLTGPNEKYGSRSIVSECLDQPAKGKIKPQARAGGGKWRAGLSPSQSVYYAWLAKNSGELCRHSGPGGGESINQPVNQSTGQSASQSLIVRHAISASVVIMLKTQNIIRLKHLYQICVL